MPPKRPPRERSAATNGLAIVSWALLFVALTAVAGGVAGTFSAGAVERGVAFDVVEADSEGAIIRVEPADDLGPGGGPIAELTNDAGQAFDAGPVELVAVDGASREDIELLNPEEAFPGDDGETTTLEAACDNQGDFDGESELTLRLEFDGDGDVSSGTVEPAVTVGVKPGCQQGGGGDPGPPEGTPGQGGN